MRLEGTRWYKQENGDGYRQKGSLDTTPPGIIPGTAGSPLRVRASPPWYWTGRYTTWNYPRNSWLPTKGLSLSSLVLDRTLHHLELSLEQPAPRPGFEPLHPWYCSGRNTTWNKSRIRRREVARLLPCPPFHFSSAFAKEFPATAAIGRTLIL